VNLEVRDGSGRFVAEVDLAYPERRVGIEYEGDHHRSDPRQFQKDIRRREQLLDVDWWILRVTNPDLHGRAPELLRRLDRTLARRAPR
jgi:very-short-patch-repair endonuclease